MGENIRLHYIKNVLGIKSVMVPEGYSPQAQETMEPLELVFQTFNQGQVLFLAHFESDLDKNFSVEEMQLLEKIIVALKLNFSKTDIAKVKLSASKNIQSKNELIEELKSKKYSFIFLLGNEISSLFQNKNFFKENGLEFFTTFHPKEMIQNPDLKKEAWTGFKGIMENLPR